MFVSSDPKFQTDTYSMDFDLDFVYPEEEEGLDENEEGEGVTQPHSGEKFKKCNQCDFASFYASALRRHLKTHSGEKSNKCSQSDFTCSLAGNLRRHLKTQWRKSKQMQSM